MRGGLRGAGTVWGARAETGVLLLRGGHLEGERHRLGIKRASPTSLGPPGGAPPGKGMGMAYANPGEMPTTPGAPLLSWGLRGRAGGQAELGRRTLGPSWSVSSCGGERGPLLSLSAGGPKDHRPILRGPQAGQRQTHEVGSV